MRDGVIFLYALDAGERRPAGTGFFVMRRVPRHDGRTVALLMTAHHVIEAIRKHGDDRKVWIRVNSKGGGAHSGLTSPSTNGFPQTPLWTAPCCHGSRRPDPAHTGLAGYSTTGSPRSTSCAARQSGLAMKCSPSGYSGTTWGRTATNQSSGSETSQPFQLTQSQRRTTGTCERSSSRPARSAASVGRRCSCTWAAFAFRATQLRQLRTTVLVLWADPRSLGRGRCRGRRRHARGRAGEGQYGNSDRRARRRDQSCFWACS